MQEDTLLLLYAVVILLLLLILVINIKGNYELFSSLDQVESQHSDPITFRYRGNERDVAGMSMRDYYLHNYMYDNNKVANVYGDNMFKNITDYREMPVEYRPILETEPSARQFS